MRGLIQKIFGAKKPTPPTPIEFTELPAWFTGLDESAKAGLVSAIREPMEEIRNTEARIRLIATTLADAEQDPVIHPKLKTIAKNSLPQFVRAIKSSTAKELPDDPEEFYAAATECLKNCLQNLRGQGRYLQAIFPEEIKTIRLGIDEMGRGINAINPLLAAYRQQTGGIRAARAIMEDIGSLRTDYTASEERARRIGARIDEMAGRGAAIERELMRLKEDPAMHEIAEKSQELITLGRQRDEALRTYSALSMTASHVFRKAEKLVARDRHVPGGTALRAATEILSDPDIPSPEQLDPALEAACPPTVQLIGAGQIPLKNKEERTLFSDIPSFRSAICTAAGGFRSLDEQCRAAESALATHRITVAMESLEREKAQLLVMLAREKQALIELSEWQEKTLAHIPALYADLRARVDTLSGNTRVLGDYRDAPAPVPPAES